MWPEVYEHLVYEVSGYDSLYRGLILNRRCTRFQVTTTTNLSRRLHMHEPVSESCLQYIRHTMNAWYDGRPHVSAKCTCPPCKEWLPTSRLETDSFTYNKLIIAASDITYRLPQWLFFGYFSTTSAATWTDMNVGKSFEWD